MLNQNEPSPSVKPVINQGFKLSLLFVSAGKPPRSIIVPIGNGACILLQLINLGVTISAKVPPSPLLNYLWLSPWCLTKKR